jgi:hypothetical protein
VYEEIDFHSLRPKKREDDWPLSEMSSSTHVTFRGSELRTGAFFTILDLSVFLRDSLLACRKYLLQWTDCNSHVFTRSAMDARGSCVFPGKF